MCRSRSSLATLDHGIVLMFNDVRDLETLTKSYSQTVLYFNPDDSRLPDNEDRWGNFVKEEVIGDDPRSFR